MKYFEEDSQLRDILVTGGDALMSTDGALEGILDAIYEMARAKREANRMRASERKYAEIVRVRLASRLLAYLPQRITPELTEILARFRARATEVGVKQFVIQTHIESPMEVTPETRDAVARLLSAGWIVTNQLVFTAAASRRGHTNKLRKILNNIGVLPYYNFVLKGYRENTFNYAPVARAVQEEQEEKAIGRVPNQFREAIRQLPEDGETLISKIGTIRAEASLPFLATDRTVLNLPAVGKSLTFRTIGITRYGRRILEFDHDRTRAHSPIIDHRVEVDQRVPGSARRAGRERRGVRQHLRLLAGRDRAAHADLRVPALRLRGDRRDHEPRVGGFARHGTNARFVRRLLRMRLGLAAPQARDLAEPLTVR